MNGRKKFGRILGAAGALTMVGAVLVGPGVAGADQPEQRTAKVTWVGNGAPGGVCSSFDQQDSKLTPGVGEQGWHFVLTSSFADVTTTLTFQFSTGSSSTATGTASGGMYHFYVYAPIGATLVSASADNGTEQFNASKEEWNLMSQLNVSHCKRGLPEDVTTTSQEDVTTTSQEDVTTTSLESDVPTTTEDKQSEPPVPDESPESGALPQTGWLGTNLTMLLGLAMLAAGGLAIGFTRRSAKS